MSAPAQPRRVVLDTDTYNEVDDQFALAHLLLSPDAVDLEAVYAAPFYYPSVNKRSSSAADGMEKSYDEIHRVLEVCGRQPHDGVLKGSRSFLPSATTPVESPAAADLVERAMSGRDRLVVCAIGAITNVASALLMEPRIADRIEIVWLGGHAHYWHDTAEFNLMQDLHATRHVLQCRAPLVQLPCRPVISHVSTSVYELEALLAPHSRLGAYLTDIVRSYTDDVAGWSKVIWDLAATAYIVSPGMFTTATCRAPYVTDDLHWQENPEGREMQVVTWAWRDAIFRDFFSKARTADTTL